MRVYHIVLYLHYFFKSLLCQFLYKFAWFIFLAFFYFFIRDNRLFIFGSIHCIKFLWIFSLYFIILLKLKQIIKVPFRCKYRTRSVFIKVWDFISFTVHSKSSQAWILRPINGHAIHIKMIKNLQIWNRSLLILKSELNVIKLLMFIHFGCNFISKIWLTNLINCLKVTVCYCCLEVEEMVLKLKI